MPYYSYVCGNCGIEFDKFVPYIEGTKNTIKCPECKKFKAKRKVSKPNIIFKGEGFYKTDSRKKPEKED